MRTNGYFTWRGQQVRKGRVTEYVEVQQFVLGHNEPWMYVAHSIACKHWPAADRGGNVENLTAVGSTSSHLPSGAATIVFIRLPRDAAAASMTR